MAKLTRWVIYGTPSDEFKKANADFHPIYMTPFDGLSGDGIGLWAKGRELGSGHR